MKNYQQIIASAINHIANGGKIILRPRCQGKPMKELDVQELINMNYRILTLLGYATAIIHDSPILQLGNNDQKYQWFMQAIQAVVYENKPLPPMP